jgi:hypothetical protein
MNDETNEPLVPGENYSRFAVIAVITVVILTAVTVGAYQFARKRSGTTVLPGGTTYLGPSESPTPVPVQPGQGKFTAGADVQWLEYKGKSYPFVFSYPKTLQIVTFQNDPTESVGISWNNIPPQNNIMFRINDIRLTEPTMLEFIEKPKIEYVKNWWKQYTGGLKGVATVSQFTNSRGMVGYKAKYINQANQTPNDDVFFEVPGRKDLMIRFGNGSLDAMVFDKVIDSFFWGKSQSAPAEPTVETTP